MKKTIIVAQSSDGLLAKIQNQQPGVRKEKEGTIFYWKAQFIIYFLGEYTQIFFSVWGFESLPT